MMSELVSPHPRTPDLDRLIEDALSEMAAVEDDFVYSSSAVLPLCSLSDLKDNLPEATSTRVVDVSSISIEEMSPISLSPPGGVGYLSSSSPGHSSEGETAAGSSSSAVCQVCGNTATRHLHYGTYACHSCRAFFRRAVDNEKYTLFICNEGKNCVVRPKSWKSCKSCRFQKCLRAGMNVSSVLDNDQKTMRSIKRSRTAVAIRNQFQSLPKVPEDKFTIDDFYLVKKLYRNFLRLDPLRVTLSSMESMGSSFIGPFMHALGSGMPFSIDIISMMENICIAAGIECLSDSFDRDIAEPDRSALRRQGSDTLISCFCSVL
jgi:hypothetical protein